MKVGRFVLHGTPQSGKSSARDLLVNTPPVKKESTRLVKDPVKAVSTRSVTTGKFVSYQSLLEEIEEEKMIRMIQRQVTQPARERMRKRKSKIESQAELHHPVPTGHSIPTKPLATTTISYVEPPHYELCNASLLPLLPLQLKYFTHIIDSLNLAWLQH